jgi:hypothetical protein
MNTQSTRSRSQSAATFVRPAYYAIIALLALGACGGNADNNPGTDAGPDGPLLPDDGPCAPGALRCNGNNAQQCNAEGTRWETLEVCTTFCQDGLCALDGLDVAADMALEGSVLVAGAVTVRNGATLSSTTGNLTITADSITVESGGSISMAPTGNSPLGKGTDVFTCTSCTPGGGGYGTVRPWGSDTDSDVQAGSPGGRMTTSVTPQPEAAPGGGVVKLLATQIVIAGQITANGANGGSNTTGCAVGGGGGSGGGILLAGDDITVSGSISAAGGLGGPTNPNCGLPLFGGVGGDGRVKILHGAHVDVVAGGVVGRLTKGLAPPIPLRSLSHPDPTKIYNDGFLSLDVSWTKAFPSLQGYYVRLDNTPLSPPTAADAEFLSVDKVSFSPNDVSEGANFVHIVSVDAQSAIGTVETVFPLQINTQGPSVASSSHPDEATFTSNTNPFFTWNYPQGDENVAGAYYVLDQFGTTVPSAADTPVPATQKQLLKSGVTEGVWVLHVVSIDTAGRLSKQAGHYRVNIGTDPGAGAVIGRVVNAQALAVPNATVSINRGLYETTTDSAGNFTLTGVTAGSWELSVKSGAATSSKTITVVTNQTTPGDMTL